MAVLVVVAWVLIGVLALAALLVCLVLFVPASFTAGGDVSLEPSEGAGSSWEGAYGLDLAAEKEDVDDSDEGGQAGFPSIQASFTGRFSWMGGAVVVDQDGITVFGWKRRFHARGRAPGGEAREERARRKERPSRGRRTGGRRLDLATVRRLLPAAWKAFLRTWSALRLRLNVRLAYGTGDPATTAFAAIPVAAAIYPLARAANARRAGSIGLELKPVFDREMIAADFDLSGRTSVFALLWPLARFALRRDVRRLWWRRGRRRGPGKGDSGKTRMEKEAA